jgi:hypothetical protein
MYVSEFRSVGVSMFQMDMEHVMKDNLSVNKEPQISLFDVKELYDAAYAIKDVAHPTSAYEFRDALGKAVKMDMVYRRQLTLKKGVTQDDKSDFSPAIEVHRKDETQFA